MRGRLVVGLLIAALLIGSGVTASTAPDRKFDEFGDINCEDEMARLDNFAVNLQNEPSTIGVIVFYGGRRFRGRLQRRGEAAMRAGRLKPYLVNRRGLAADRVKVINGGYAEEWHVDLWIIPPGVTLPEPSPTVPAREIKFRKGKATPRQFRCEI